jgi:hypothetical protein
MYTNNTAFRYTLTDVSIINEDGSLKHQGSLVYHNNPLKNCTLSGTQIEFEGLQRPALNIARQMQGASTLTRVGCNVETLQGTMAINLTVAYNYQMIKPFIIPNTPSLAATPPRMRAFIGGSHYS